MTVGNGHKMKCEIKDLVNMNMKVRETVKPPEVLCVTKSVNNVLSVSSIVSKESTMGATQDKMTIKKNGVSMILNAIKERNTSMIFYLNTKRYVSERQVARTNLP